MAKTKKKDDDKNIGISVKGNTLTLTVELDQELRESESGKSTIVADTGQFINIEDVEDDDYQYGLKMIVTKREAKKKKEK